MAKRFSSKSLYLYTLLGMALGVAVGVIFGKQAAPLGGIAKVIIWVIKTAAIPLLFMAILDAILRSEFRGASLARLLVICLINACCAITIGLALSNLFVPGQYMPLSQLTGNGPGATRLGNAGTNDALGLFLTSPMILAILVSLVSGALLVCIEHFFSSSPFARQVKRLRGGVSIGLIYWMQFMELVLFAVPLAVFGAVAKVIGEHGFAMVTGLSAYFFICVAGMLLHIFLVYHGWVVGIARIPFRRFWREAREPVVHAFGINSSLATLPFTLRALDRLKVSPASARLSACVGTNFNNDGILLYEVVAVFFMAQAYGIHLTLAQQLMTALICVVATVGVGGIPEAGIISLALVLGAVHLPAEGLTILLTVDWVIARLRSATNVLGDMSVAVAVDHFHRRDAAA